MIKRKFENPFYNVIWDRVHNRRTNAILCCVGEVGTGKSLTAIRIASELDPTFNENTIRERVVVTPEQFTDLIVNKADKLKTGSAIVIDEASQSLSNRDWYSITSKQINFILQTFRYRRLIVIFTLPSLSFLDSATRKLIDYVIETRKIDFTRNQCSAKVYRITYDKIKPDKIYRRRITAFNEIGEPVLMRRFKFKKPKAKLAHAYEKYSYEFKRQIALNAYKEIEQVRDKRAKQLFNPEEVAQEVVQDIDSYYKTYNKKKYLNKVKIQTDFNIGSRRASKVAQKVQELLDERGT